MRLHCLRDAAQEMCNRESAVGSYMSAQWHGEAIVLPTRLETSRRAPVPDRDLWFRAKEPEKIQHLRGKLDKRWAHGEPGWMGVCSGMEISRCPVFFLLFFGSDPVASRRDCFGF